MSVSECSARDVVQAALAKVRADRQRQLAERALEATRAERKARQAEQVDLDDDDAPAASERRYEQLTRIMLVIDLVAPLRHGATVAMMHPDVCQEYGQVSTRTVYRDLLVLEALGLLDREGDRFFWRDGNFRSIVQREVARSWRKAAAEREEQFKKNGLIAAMRRHADAEGWTERAEA